MTSTGDYTMGILVPLGNKENSDGTCGELIKRIFILLGSNENSGEEGLLLGSKSRSLDYLPLYWGVILGWGKTKVSCCLVDF